MPRSKKQTGNEPANKQKGEKVCNFCHEKKKLTDFYISKSPLFSVDERVPICKDCVISASLNEDGTINDIELNKILKKIDRPYYKDLIESAISGFKNEHSYVEDDKVQYYGKEILQRYFRLIAMRQDINKSYEDSERDNFIHPTSNTPKSTKERIAKKYDDIKENKNEYQSIQNSDGNVKWSEQDLQNKKYAIEVIGYDPFEDYPEESRKFLFNQLSPYLEDDNNVDDTYKLSQILQIIKNNNQIDICDKKMSILDPLKDADSVKVLNEIKNKLVQSNDKIAKENEISVKNRSNKDAGKSTLTYLMRDLRQKDFDKAEADYYDQLRSPGTRWAVDMSITSIKQNGMFDENDKKEVYEMQLDLIDSLNQQLDEAKEKIRLLTKENDRLKLQLEKVGE